MSLLIKHQARSLISILEVFGIFVLPIILLATGWLPIPLRNLLAIPVAILIIQSVLREKWSFKKLGFRTDNFRQSILPYSVFTIIVLGVIVFGAVLLERHPIETLFTSSHFKYFFLVTSFFQEFAYRGYLVPKLESFITSTTIQVIVNSLLFSVLHYFFPQPEIVLPGTFILGAVLTLLYKRYPNLLLVSIAHSVINFVAVMFCFASLNLSCQ